MKKKSFKTMSLILTAVMILSSVNPAAVAVAAPADSAYEAQDVEIVTEEETSETVTEEATTQEVATEVTTQEVTETITEEEKESVTEEVTEAATQAEVSTEAATEAPAEEVATETAGEKMEAEEVEVEKEQKRTITNGSALLSTQMPDAALLNLVANAISKTAATATVDDLVNYNGSLVLSSSAVKSIAGLGLAHNATSIDISGLSGVTAIPDNEFQACAFTTFKMSTKINSIGEMAFYECKNMTTIYTGSSKNTLPSNLTSVGQKAFGNCEKLTTISIPYLQDEGAVGMFQFCQNLTSVTFGSGVTRIPVAMFLSAGTNSTGMKVSFTNATSLDKILGEAFYNAKFAEATTIDLSKCTKMTGIDSSAFRSSVNLNAVALPTSLTSLQIGSYTFADTDITAMYTGSAVKMGINMPNYITSLGDAAFYNCQSITKVVLSTKLPAIRDYTFDCCEKLSQVTNNGSASSVTWIGDAAFRSTAIMDTSFMLQMTNLTQIGRQLHDTFDNGDSTVDVERIPYGGLNTDPKKEFTINDANQKFYNKKPVGSEVFTDCTQLKTVEIPGSVKIIGNRAFYFEEPSVVDSVMWATAQTPIAGTTRRTYAEAFCLNESLTQVVLPENKGESLIIGPATFSECYLLEKIGKLGSSNNTLPNTISQLGNLAFYGCMTLPEIHIQAYNGAEPKLGTQMFEFCYSLEKATLPSQTTKIPYNFFAGCPMSSFNFNEMTNLVEIAQLAFVGNQFTTIDLSNCNKLQILNAGCIAYNDCVKKPQYMKGVQDYRITPAPGTSAKLNTVILPTTQPAGMHFDTGLFYGQELFKTLYKKGSTVNNQVVIPSYVLPHKGDAQGMFGYSGVVKVVWEADTDASAADNRWKDVGPYAFIGCKGIVDAKDVLPKYLVNIQRSAFTESSIVSADLSSFTDLAVISSGSATSTGVLKGAFAACPLLATVKLPATTTAKDGIAVKEETFKESTTLKNVDLGAATSLDKNAFAGCTALTAIDLKNVKVAGEYAFVECENLQSVKFGNVEKIGNYAFQKCSSLVLTNTPLPDSLTKLGNYAFSEATSLGKVTFGSGIEEIGSNTFAKSGITSVDFTRAAALKKIGTNAFAQSTIKTFDISGTQVELIPNKMLFDCANLTKATFGEEIVYISDNAIAGCPVFKTLSFYTTTTVDEKVFYTKGSNTKMYTGQMNTGASNANITIDVLANTPDNVIIPLDRELDFPYYVNKKGTSNIHYVCILDKAAPTDLTVEEHLFLSAKTNDGYYKVTNSNDDNNKYKVSSQYYEALPAAPTTTVTNNRVVDVIRVTGLKESGKRDLRLKIYADVQFVVEDKSGVTYKASPFNAEYKITIQDPQTTALLYQDSKHAVTIPTTSNIQVTKKNMSIRYFYDLVDKVQTGAKQDNYNVVIKSSNPNVLAVGTSTSASSASGTCETNIKTVSDSNKGFYVFPKALGTATLTIYPALYDESEREKHKSVYTFTVNSNIQSLTLEVPSEYKNKINPGSAFCVFKEYKNYFDQICNKDNIAQFTKLTNSKITFTSSAPDYVSVDQMGNVKILKADPTSKQVVITATYPGATSTTSKKISLSVKYPEVKTNTTMTDNLTGSKFAVTKKSTKDLEGEVTYEGPTNKKSKTVVIPDTIAVNGVKYKVTAVKDKAFKGNKKVKTVKIGKYVKKIGKEAFSGCTALTKVTIGNAVETIDEKAFYKCKKLKTVSISYKKSKLRMIGTSAFQSCVKLTKITLPKKLKTINMKAFYGCKKLKTITVKSTVLSSVGTDALKGIYKKATIKVPKKQLSKYKNLFKGKGQSSSVKIKKG